MVTAAPRPTRRQALAAALRTLGGIIAERAFLPPARARAAAPGELASVAPPSLWPRTQQRSFQSELLSRAMPYSVYVPPGYEAAPSARYPVLYMLHGLGGDYTEWAHYGLLAEADRLMRRGEIAPFLIVLPEGDRAYWVDHAYGGLAWGSYVAREVVAEIDGRFRTRADRAHRAIGGVSMGAHGALQLALNFPGTFGIVGAHTPVLRAYTEAPPYFGSPAYFAAHTPVGLVRRSPATARTLVIWIDIGLQDGWFPQAARFHEELLALRVPHEWHVYPGGHTGLYWGAHIEDYLHFYGPALEGAEPPPAPRA
jgi:enterochelin esterase-like enzyme